MRVLQIVPRIATESSGPSTSVPSLCRALAERGDDVELFALEPAAAKPIFDRVRYFPCAALPFAHRLGWSPRMRQALERESRAFDVVHTSSLWMMPNIYPGLVRERGDSKLVVSPRGTLSAWSRARSKLRKAVVWRLGQRAALEAADCIHATSVEELRDIRRMGLKTPVALIPNGVDCPESFVERDESRSRRTCLFLARIHPTKGVDRLLEAWRRLAADFPAWDCKIAGPLDSAYAQQVQADAGRSSEARVEFLGEVRGEAKARLFRAADLYVLPTHSENFGISVAEALSHGVPSIVFRGAPWEGLNEQDAGWWIEPDLEVLTNKMREAMQMSDAQRAAMGRRGHAWVRAEFAWPGLAARMQRVYRWLRQPGSYPRPADVHVDGC